MEIQLRKITDYKDLFRYYQKVSQNIPYWMHVDYETWLESFCNDSDYDADMMFRQLLTYTAEQKGDICGFIQFGIPNFLYDTQGEKSREHQGGIIRNFYFEPGMEQAGRKLLDLAQDYFQQNRVTQKFAFFHAFGMTCNAGHGKLYTKLTHVEQLLKAYGFIKEHENVYYSRLLSAADAGRKTKVELAYGEMNSKGMCEFSIHADGEWIGAGAYAQLPQGEISYLRWIFLDGKQQGKGYGTAALQSLFAHLAAAGMKRLDTDTADGNEIAQKLYLKTGFQDLGRTRSFLIPEK